MKPNLNIVSFGWQKEGEREERRGSDNALECASESYKRRHAVEARALAPGKVGLPH